MENKIRPEDVAQTLRDALKAGQCKFQFIKKDHTLRNAVGTLNLDLVPETDKQFVHKEGEREERDDQTSFYDLEKMAWRCCKFDSVTNINGMEVI